MTEPQDQVSDVAFIEARRIEPQLGNHQLLDRDDTPFEIYGRLLGFASSQRDEHDHPESYARPGDRCSACRWFEVRIFRVEAEYADDCNCPLGELPDRTHHAPRCGMESPRARYLLLSYGRTIIPSEINKRRAVWTNSPFTIISALTQRRGVGSFLPVTSDIVLAEASAYDDAIRAAYLDRVNRLVA